MCTTNTNSQIQGFKFQQFIKSIKLHPNQRTFKVFLVFLVHFPLSTQLLLYFLTYKYVMLYVYKEWYKKQDGKIKQQKLRNSIHIRLIDWKNNEEKKTPQPILIRQTKNCTYEYLCQWLKFYKFTFFWYHSKSKPHYQKISLKAVFVIFNIRKWKSYGKYVFCFDDLKGNQLKKRKVVWVMNFMIINMVMCMKYEFLIKLWHTFKTSGLKSYFKNGHKN